MTCESASLGSMLEAHFAGQPVEVPVEFQEQFHQAVVAHQALRGILDETMVASPQSAVRRPPEVSEHYLIERELGHGGMGVVYLARQRSLNRLVALKVLRPGEQTFGPLVQRFLEEAQHLAQLRHPNIVSIHEVGSADGEPYFTMDYIDGEPLSDVIARGPQTPSRAVQVLTQVAAAVQHAHRQGIIHRDLKPGNVLMDRSGQVFVTDFGLARNVSQSSSLTQSGELLGTPQYMSPEQARGQSVLIGEATDIHALGLLLFEMLSGRAAFGASSPAEILVRLLNEDPPPLRSFDRRIPRDLETICLKALQKSPADRYTNVSAMLEDLRRYEAGEPLLAKRTGVLRILIRWAGRHWKLAASVVITALLAAAVAPILLDKSVEDLVVWGREELGQGRYQIAAEVLQRAWMRGNSDQRTAIVPDLVEAIRYLDDSKQAVDAALNVIRFAPDASFGKHDFLVAQAVAMDARSETPNDTFEPGHASISSDSFVKRDLAARRLSLFLEGASGSKADRDEAEKTLDAIARSLRNVRPTERWTTDDLVSLPQGQAYELAERAGNSDLSPWERGKAAFSLGRLHAVSGDRIQAARQYRIALDHLRRVYPFVSGVVSDSQISSDGRNTTQADAPECRLIHELLQSLHELEPDDDLDIAGGLRLTLDHPEFLEGGHISARLLLCDESIAFPHAGLSRNLSTSVPFDQTAVREVRTLPGRYRLALAGTMFNWNTPTFKPGLIEISAEQWPGSIDISGDIIDLPSLNVRKLEEILLRTPEAHARVSLQKDSITWAPVANAASYDVTLGHFSEMPHLTSSWFHRITTDQPELVASQLSNADRQVVRAQWKPGRMAGIRVQALNADGRRIAVTLEERRFLIAGELAQ